ncbi:MAG: hypothetical protein KDC66_23455 [Phaeodactylibacter sp.]|nr:hypothetical protein [Phaeodactylibacter sp.]MCB9273398.1 acyl-ACP thioesterase [Lewinellaceae bacterium]
MPISIPLSELGYQRHYEVRTYEIDSQKRMNVPAIARLMQEAAMQNVIKMGLSVWDLEPHHISWVLMRKQIKITRMPVLGERIVVATYPSGFERMFTYRDYKVFDEAGKLLAASSSCWLLMDTASRRMAPLPDFILAYAKHMPPAEACLPRPETRLPAFKTPEYTRQFEVNWHDLDFNEHLNNTLYIKWMLDPLPPAVLTRQQLQKLDINYRAESQYQDVVQAQVQPSEDGAFLHRLLRVSDGKELAVARTEWLNG